MIISISDAPDAAQLHPSGKRYHINCGGEVIGLEGQVMDLSGMAKQWQTNSEHMECAKCGARWCKGRLGWIRVRAGVLSWVLFR